MIIFVERRLPLSALRSKSSYSRLHENSLECAKPTSPLVGLTATKVRYVCMYFTVQSALPPVAFSFRNGKGARRWKFTRGLGKAFMSWERRNLSLLSKLSGSDMAMI